jgi:outer membrane protein OmpA-like peptidoglycan-associated protein
MRILITGAVAFVIWCFISAWLYNDHLVPALNKPVPVVTVTENRNNEADSLMKLKASMPADLLIYFRFDESQFKPDQQFESSLAPFRAWLEKYPGSKLVVTGNTDLVGTPEFNMELGQKRAETVTKNLVSLGIPADRIITESLGETRPAAEYISPDGRAKNRRTEITIKMQ